MIALFRANALCCPSFGASGQPLRPHLWARYCSSATLNTYHSLNATILERLSNLITAEWRVQLAVAKQEYEPTVHTEAAALQPKDWLRLRLD